MFFNSQVAILANQMVTQRSHKRSGRSAISPMFPAILLFVVLVVQLLVRLSIIEQGYELERVRKAALSRDIQLRELNLHFAYLSRPSLLVERATKNLAMVDTPRDRLRQLSRQEVEG